MITAVRHSVSSLGIPSYRRLWYVIACANAASWAFTMVLGWQMFAVTRSSAWVGAVMFASLVPNTAGAPLVGTIADRVDRVQMLRVALLCAAVVCAVLFGMSLEQVFTPAMIVLLAGLFGLCLSVANISISALLPSFVQPEALFNAVSLQGVAQRGTEFFGPFVASPLLVVLGPAAVYSFCGLLALFGLAITARLPASRMAAPAATGFLRTFSEGLEYVRKVPSLATLLGIVGVHCILTMAYMGILPDFVNDEVHGASGLYGTMMSIIGMGAFAGTLFLAAVRSTHQRRRLFWLMAITSGLSTALLGLCHESSAALLCSFFMGVTQSMFMTIQSAFIQERTENAVRGRVMSLNLLLAAGGMAVGNWGYGALAGFLKPHAIFLVMGILFIVFCGLMGILSPAFRALCQWRPDEGAAPQILEHATVNPVVVDEVEGTR